MPEHIMGLFNGNVLGVTGCGDRHAGHGCVGYDYMKLANQSGVFRGSYFDDLQLLSLRDSILFFVVYLKYFLYLCSRFDI